MTGPRRARSAALLVGVTPGTVRNVQSAGQSFRRVVREPAVKTVALGFLAGVFEQLPQLGLDWCHLDSEPSAVVMLDVGMPGLKQPAGELKAGLPEALLGSQALAVEPEVALEMTPAGLSLLGIEEVIRPPAIGGHDPLKLATEQFLQPVAVAIPSRSGRSPLAGSRPSTSCDSRRLGTSRSHRR